MKPAPRRPRFSVETNGDDDEHGDEEVGVGDGIIFAYNDNSMFQAYLTHHSQRATFHVIFSLPGNVIPVIHQLDFLFSILAHVIISKFHENPNDVCGSALKSLES